VEWRRVREGRFQMPSQFPESIDLPLFPLPGVVLFPGSVLPLRIFEPRYRKMLQDVLASRRLIGMAHLKDPSETAPVEPGSLQPQVYPIIGVGKIVAHEPQADGTSNIALLGQARCRIDREIPHQPYRIASLTTLCDQVGKSPEEQQMVVFARTSLMKVANDVIARTIDESSSKKLQAALKERNEAGAVADLLASMFVQHTGLRQTLLESLDVLERIRLLHAVMEKLMTKLDPKPPPIRYRHDDYSIN
jgi:Lon protease-like protein